MGQNSTEVAYNFGQFGSTYLQGDGSKLDLDGATALYYIVAITMTEAVTFQTLGILDGGLNNGMTPTHFASTEDTQTLDTDWGAVTALADDDGVVITTSHTFGAGVTIYGQWDFVELNSGGCFCYIAPRPDYASRA